MTTEARDALAKAGFEPDFNVCATCHHHGSEHDLNNKCLVCGDRFASMTEDEKWEHGLAALDGWTLVPDVQEAWRHQMARLVNNEKRRQAAMEVIVRSRIEGLDMWLAELLTAGAALGASDDE